MDDIALHPEAKWCMDKELELAIDDDIKGDGSSISSLPPRPPEAATLAELHRAVVIPKEWKALHSLDHFTIHEERNREARLETKRVKLAEKENKKAAKEKIRADKREAKEAAKKKTVKPQKKKATPLNVMEDALLPAAGALVEYYWPSGDAEGWYKCTYQREEKGSEDEMTSVVLDAEGAVENLFGVTLEDLEWRCLYHCDMCRTDTHGVGAKCGVCRDYRDVNYAGGDSDSDDEDF